MEVIEVSSARRVQSLNHCDAYRGLVEIQALLLLELISRLKHVRKFRVVLDVLEDHKLRQDVEIIHDVIRIAPENGILLVPVQPLLRTHSHDIFKVSARELTVMIAMLTSHDGENDPAQHISTVALPVLSQRLVQIRPLHNDKELPMPFAIWQHIHLARDWKGIRKVVAERTLHANRRQCTDRLDPTHLRLEDNGN